MAQDHETPGNVGDSHNELNAIRDEFYSSTAPTQRLVVSLSDAIAKPAVVIVVSALALAWVATNTLFPARAFDPPPFSFLQSLATIFALVLALLILSGQRREDEAMRRMSRLTLYLAAGSEEKIAKLIGLIEEQRRDSAVLPNRDDEEAESMTTPIRPRDIMERFQRA